MMAPAIMLNLTWSFVSTVIAYATAFVGSVAAVAAGFWYKFKGRKSELEAQDAISKENLNTQTVQLREQALQLYKDLYEAEKIRSQDKFSDLSDRINRNQTRLTEIESDNEKLRRENSSLKDINLKWQEQARNDSLEIASLRQRIQNLESHVVNTETLLHTTK